MEDEFKQGLMFGDKDDILAGGFNVNVRSKVSDVRVTASFFPQHSVFPQL